MKSLFSIILAGVLALGALDASAAKRMGGGKSIGQQSSNVTQREAAKSPPAAPSQAAAAPTGAANNAAAGAAAPKKPWGAMLGGLAAGLGLAWLASSLGFGEAFGQILLFLLLAVVVVAVVGMILRARRGAGPAQSHLAMQGAGGSPSGAMPRSYSPDHVGNDASARPWERSSTSFDAARYAPQTGGSVIGSALGGSQSWGIPSDFDTAGFVAAAKRNFVTLQDAWDRSDIATLRAMMTDGMLEEIRSQLAEREKQSSGQPNRTEVFMLEAQLLGIADSAGEYMASVEFNGMIREDPSSGPNPFREVWNMTKPKDGSGGWLVAGVQALQ